MRKLQEDIKLILDYCNVERAMNFEERKAYNRLLDFTQLHSIYQGIPVEDSLDEQEERIQEVEERNQRQYERLKEITDLMSKRDRETLEKIVEDWEQTEELLQAEFGNYGGVDG